MKRIRRRASWSSSKAGRSSSKGRTHTGDLCIENHRAEREREIMCVCVNLGARLEAAAALVRRELVEQVGEHARERLREQNAHRVAEQTRHEASAESTYA